MIIPLESRLNPKWKIVIALVTFLMLTNTIYSTINPIDNQNKSPFRLIVTIDVEKPDGTIIHECIEDDIILRNFVYFLINSLEGSGDSSSYDLIDTTGTTKNYQTVHKVDEAVITVGDGNTPVTVTDYVLDNEIIQLSITNNQFKNTAMEYNATVISTWNPASSYTIREVGLITGLSTSENYLICRDVLTTSVSVTSGDIITIKYVFLMNQG